MILDFTGTVVDLDNIAFFWCINTDKGTKNRFEKILLGNYSVKVSSQKRC
jgi:hypothetical protein